MRRPAPQAAAVQALAGLRVLAVRRVPAVHRWPAARGLRVAGAEQPVVEPVVQRLWKWPRPKRPH